jgi:PPOX class probable F420-dependent enzyme
VDEAHARLATAQVGWITTVGPSGQPQTSPVWFVWDGEAIHIATRPDAPKARNVRANSRVAFNTDGAAPGELVVTVEGDAVVTAGLDGTLVDAYVDKYRAGLERLGLTAGEYVETFSGALRITPSRWRVFLSE